MKALLLSCLTASLLLTTVVGYTQTTPATTTSAADKAAADAKAKADKKAAAKQARADKKAAAAAAKVTAVTPTPPATPAVSPNPPATPATVKNAPATPKTVTQGVNKSADKAVGTDAKGRTIYEGPRGGRYTLTANGNKEYIKKN
ncbi:MAG TPA: hypothetical protein VNS58_00305 [Puia sp.]|nr:hypothetical protein [Puia sp.]